ncbi:ATP-dependent zinc metalloprotease FTSH 1, chloroplastic [Triticum urartu]|uniref:ATP-dependent zinc metalloprotease FTSH 1, chloroplastic n=2 Tax=Triticum TaxID=4564 RepID=M8ADT2_TRIUA|nr:ATP-dependent zinc metalloprotease FTSH 1, chloroplastic [Triticum urartu]
MSVRLPLVPLLTMLDCDGFFNEMKMDLILSCLIAQSMINYHFVPYDNLFPTMVLIKVINQEPLIVSESVGESCLQCGVKRFRELVEISQPQSHLWPPSPPRPQKTNLSLISPPPHPRLRRVRDLFEKAKAKAPCIVFIDEIDAVGRQRGAGMGGGNDEREQTINQLLTEMDGFSGNSGVIVLAATNRPDVLDSALLRPGRFDRQVTVDRPDVAGRVRILEVHSRGKALAKDVDFDKVARRTPGFTGADLQNLMNEAAILAARRDLKEISKDEISDALERIIAGPEKKNAVVSEQKRKLVAYHEAGHALVGALMPEYDPVAKISIIPRGQAGGLTFFAPSEERLESGLYSRSYLENQMAVALGGRVAEEVIFGQDNVTTGASSDFMQVSRVARQMVERFGFSKKIGQVAIGSSGGNPFLGQQMSSQKDYSMATADIVDAEVRELVETAYSRATQIINTHIDILHRLANLLIEKETVDGEEFMSLFIDGQAELFVA